MPQQRRSATPNANADGGWQSSPYLLLAFLCAAAAIAYAQRQVVAVTKEAIQAEFGFSKNQIGWILSAFFAGYSLLQVPVGWAGDTYGALRTLTACVLFSALATALLPVAASVEAMLAVWTVCGMAQAGLFPVAARLIVAVFPATRRATASGWLASSMSVGAAVMAATGGELLGLNVRWQIVVLTAAVPGFIWAIAFAVFSRKRIDHRERQGGGAAGVGRPARSFVAKDGLEGRLTGGFWDRLSRPNLWLVCLQQFLRAAAYIFFVSWFSTYLRETGAIGVDEAGWLNGLPLLAAVVGSPFGGCVSDFVFTRTGSRRVSQQWLVIVSLLTCAGCVITSLSIANPVTATALISAGAFCAAMCGPIAYAVTMQVGGERVATVFAVINMCGNLGAATFPIVAAALRTATGDWNLVLALFAGIYVAAAACWTLIDPN